MSRSSGGNTLEHLAVEAIDDKVMREFIPWRRDYYANFKKLPKNAKLHPTDKTLQWDMMLGKAIVRWAHEQGLRGNKAADHRNLHAEEEAGAACVRDTGISALWRTMYKRINDAKDERTRRSRELLRVYVLVLANSGMRIGEANNLQMT